MLERGLVQIYTGDGKGKTTAALGLAMRATGRGGSVLIYQFLKPATLELGERVAMQALEGITFKLPEGAWDMAKSFQDPQAVKHMRSRISQVCREIGQAAANKSYDMIILDEIVFCLGRDLVTLADIKNIIEKKHPQVELVLTGRGASAELIALADLVTEFKSIKHPFDKGISARSGIEY